MPTSENQSVLISTKITSRRFLHNVHIINYIITIIITRNSTMPWPHALVILNYVSSGVRTPHTGTAASGVTFYMKDNISFYTTRVKIASHYSLAHNYIKCWLIFSERELTFTFAICCRPSVVCLSVVCNVHAPYSGGSNFQQYFCGIRYLGHPLTSPLKILRRSSQGNPSDGGVKHKRGSKI